MYYSNQSPVSESSGKVAISRVGFQLWRDAGRPVGRYMEFWKEAERSLIAARGATHPVRSAKQAPAGWASF